MTKTEIIEAIKQLTNAERWEIIEAVSRITLEEIEEKARIRAERDKQMSAAAKAAVSDYEPGGDLYDLWSPDSKPYYESEEGFEAINKAVKNHA